MGAQRELMPFDVDRWRSDDEVALLGCVGRTVWFEALMVKRDRCGPLLVSLDESTRLCRVTPEEAAVGVRELELSRPCHIERRGDQVLLVDPLMRSEFIKRQREKLHRRRLIDEGRSNPLSWYSIRYRVLDRDNDECAYCGEVAGSVDHVIPRVQGGSHDKTNLVACCIPCNRRKGGRTPEQAGMMLVASTGGSHA